MKSSPLKVIPRVKLTVVQDRSHGNEKPMFRWRIFNLDTADKKVLVHGAASTLIEAVCFAGNEALTLSTQAKPAEYLGIVPDGDTPF